MSEEQTNRGHRVSKAGGKVNKKKKEARQEHEKKHGGSFNPRAFTVKSRVKAARAVQRNLDREHHKEVVDHVSKIKDTMPPPIVVCVMGPPGVGKTTFIRHLINNLQKINSLNQTEVTSPTFNLVNEYDVGIFIIQHYDLYRLTSSDQTKNIGLFENQKEVLTLIEWPDKIDDEIDNKIDLIFKYGEDMNKRFLLIKGLSTENLNEIN